MKFNLISIPLLLLFQLGVFGQAYYDVTAAEGNGFRFWNGNNNYKIHMGSGSEYRYGPVQDYSIKTNMSNGTPNRGWTWGPIGLEPIAALNISGDFQIARNFYAMNRIGVGVNTPNSIFHVKSQLGETESLARFQVGDAPTDYLQISNATGTPSQFIPRIIGYHDTDNRYALSLSGSTMESNDIGSNALLNFDARRTDGPIQTRPLFVWTNYSTKYMTMLANGNLGVGTTTPDSKLAVNGNIHAKEVKVDLVGWPDYVFKDAYELPTLAEVEKHIAENGHLINIPSEKQVKLNGIHLGEMNKLLLEKIEELTLYTIEQEKKIQWQTKRIEKIEDLEKDLYELQFMVRDILTKNNK